MTFFVSVFYEYFKTKMIIPKKMMTYKKGGLFEHYFIVGGITLVVVLIHIITGLTPFAADNPLSNTIQVISFSFVGFIFLVFTFVFLFYFIAFIYVKVTKIEDKQTFYQQHVHRMIKTAFIISFILIMLVMIAGIIGLLN